MEVAFTGEFPEGKIGRIFDFTFQNQKNSNSKSRFNNSNNNNFDNIMNRS